MIPSIFPDLPFSLASRILMALRERLAADAVLMQVLEGRLHVIELRALLGEENVLVPCLCLSLQGDREQPSGSSYGGTQETVVRAVLLTNAPTGLEDTQDFLRSRLVAHIRRLIRRNRGVLAEESGALTLAVTETRSVNFDQAQLRSRLLPTLIDVVFVTTTDLETQEEEG